MFRPNIVIDTDQNTHGTTSKAYCEEEIQHAKLKDGAYLRLIGPCMRCKTTSMNWKKGIRDPSLEPYRTIMDTRQVNKKGGAFGVYF